MTFEEKVHDTIMAILATAAMPRTSFAKSRGSAFVAMTVNAADTALPTEAEAGAVQYEMRPTSEHTKLAGAYTDEIEFATWQAFVQYPVRVAPETLIEGLSRTVAADGASRQFDLRLTEVNVEHPPRNGPDTGTFLSLTIEAHPVPA